MLKIIINTTLLVTILLISACEKKNIIRFSEVEEEYGQTVKWSPIVYKQLPAINRMSYEQEHLLVAGKGTRCVWVVNFNNEHQLNWKTKNLNNNVLLLNKQNMPTGQKLYEEILSLSNQECSDA
jgi:hypothetical protein